MSEQPIQKFAESLLNRPVHGVVELGTGATSTAWALTCAGEQFVLRTTHPVTNRPVTYRSEFVILRKLYRQGLPVPEPITHSFEHPNAVIEGASAWAITRKISGNPILKEQLPANAPAQLGDFLRQIHALPCSGYGRLDETSEDVKGQQDTPIEGICARWCWAQLWPYDHSRLETHPISQLAPELVRVLKAFETGLWNIAVEEEAFLTHSDLYGEHIYIEGQNLSGVIDFGAAFIAVPGWDFSVLAYYHGWDTVEMILEAYTDAAQQRDHLLTQAKFLAIVVALYKLEKAASAGRSEEKQHQIVLFIWKTLALL